MTSTAPPTEVARYLDSIEGERGAALRAVFDAVHGAMPDGYELGFDGRFITWEIPLSRFPKTYNAKPLQFAALAAQKNYNSLYLNGNYSEPDFDEQFRAAWAATGKKLDMGKSCLRFRTRDDVDLGLIASAIADVPVQRFLDTYERIQTDRGRA